MGGILLLAASQVESAHGDTSNASKLLGVPLELLSFKQADLGRIEKARLHSGQLLQNKKSIGELNLRTKVHFNNMDFVLSTTFKEFRSSHISGALSLIGFMQRNNSDALQNIINRYSSQFLFPVRILSND